MDWPAGFMWGGGASSTRCEGGGARAAPRRRAAGARALAAGIDVRGLFHWTAVDNYEWLHGYDVRFGLLDGDRNVKPSAEVLQREATGRT
jgi:beta-glucosidase/6-phospho-beta-glucosidase/beta-galactosidase